MRRWKSGMDGVFKWAITDYIALDAAGHTLLMVAMGWMKLYDRAVCWNNICRKSMVQGIYVSKTWNHFNCFRIDHHIRNYIN